MKVLFPDMLVHADDAPLDDTEKVLDRVCVDIAADVFFFRVSYRLMICKVSPSKYPVCCMLIRHHPCRRINMLAHGCPEILGGDSFNRE